MGWPRQAADSRSIRCVTCSNQVRVGHDGSCKACCSTVAPFTTITRGLQWQPAPDTMHNRETDSVTPRVWATLLKCCLVASTKPMTHTAKPSRFVSWTNVVAALHYDMTTLATQCTHCSQVLPAALLPRHGGVPVSCMHTRCAPLLQPTCHTGHDPGCIAQHSCAGPPRLGLQHGFSTAPTVLLGIYSTGLAGLCKIDDNKHILLICLHTRGTTR